MRGCGWVCTETAPKPRFANQEEAPFRTRSTREFLIYRDESLAMGIVRSYLLTSFYIGAENHRLNYFIFSFLGSSLNAVVAFNLEVTHAARFALKTTAAFSEEPKKENLAGKTERL